MADFIEHLSAKIGFLFAYLIFTSMAYLITSGLKFQVETYLFTAGITATITIAGATLKRWLR